MSIASWLAAAHRPPCLDLRSDEEFRSLHLPGAGNIPLSELSQRIHELPRKGTELFVVGGQMAKLAAEELAARGRWRVAWSDEPVAVWPAEQLVSGRPAPLWRPNRWLEEQWEWLLRGGRVFDLAMGSGRNAVFLARQGFRVEGEDILPEAVGFAERLAQRHGVEIAARVGDLRRDDALPTGSFDGIVVFNYLDRALLPRLAAALAAGGVLIYETFTLEQARRVGRPKNPQWLLAPMELYESFAGSLEILAYREGSAAPDRFVASLVARKAAGGDKLVDE